MRLLLLGKVPHRFLGRDLARHIHEETAAGVVRRRGPGKLYGGIVPGVAHNIGGISRAREGSGYERAGVDKFFDGCLLARHLEERGHALDRLGDDVVRIGIEADDGGDVLDDLDSFDGRVKSMIRGEVRSHHLKVAALRVRFEEIVDEPGSSRDVANGSADLVAAL